MTQTTLTQTTLTQTTLTQTTLTQTTTVTRAAALAAALSAALLAACAGSARSQQVYRADTQRVLETRNDQIQRCYDKVLASDAAATGTVTVRFVVEKKTGAFTKATVDPAHSNAKEPLVMCVLEAMNGLKLEPPDAREGRAAFTYELAPTAPAAPAAM